MLQFKTLLLALQAHYTEPDDGLVSVLFDVGTDFDYPESEAFFEIGSDIFYPALNLSFSADSDSVYPSSIVTFDATSSTEADAPFGKLEISFNTSTEDQQIPKIGIQIGSVD